MSVLLQRMTDFWISYDDSHNDKKVSHEFRFILQQKLELFISDVRGDGACGWRAFITGVIRIICGKQLPYDPARMQEFIYEVKLLLIELMHIIAQNPINKDFINNVLTNPDDGAPKTLYTYEIMILDPSYQATNYNLRMLCILFGLVNPQLTQVNIIRSVPLFGEIYQSITGIGHILPVSNDQINILHVPGHYKSIVSLTEGVLPHIILPDEAIIIN
jgi:hypothetical protein